MPVYAVIATKNAEEIGRKIESDHAGNYFNVKDDSWLVDCKQTTRELAESLGIRSGDIGSGLVILLRNYSGRASAETWEWLEIHMPDGPQYYG